MGTLSGWSYYKDITITGQSGAGIDYQVELEIGDSAGGDFHLEGHCTTFPQDIRITDDDGTTLLDHFVEDLTADPIIVHVEVKDDLDSNQNIRVYYGKSGETSASNGANTFIQYRGSATSIYKDSNIIANNFAYEIKVKHGSDTNTHIQFGVSDIAYWDIGDAVHFDIYYKAGYGSNGYNANSGISGIGMDGVLWTPNTYYRMKSTYDGTTSTFYKNGVSLGTVTLNNPNATMGMNLKVITGSFEQTFSFIRKYNSPEPTFSSAGAEQSLIGWSDTIIGVSSPGKVNGIAAADISKIMGVA